MAAVFSDGQVASFPLDDVDLLPRDSNPFKALAGGCHLAGKAIRSVDTCLLQSMAVTCGEDRCIRVWDYERRYCAVSKHFPSEDIHCVAIHPSGLHVAAGFGDKVRLFNVMVKDLKCFAELNDAKNVKQIAFSNQGSYIAASYHATIVLYSTFSQEKLGVLAAHNLKVTSLVWSPDDRVLLSSGQDGGVYEWRIDTQERVAEHDPHLMRGVQYSDAIITPAKGMELQVRGARGNILACGNDGKIREIGKDGEELAGAISVSAHSMAENADEPQVVKVRASCRTPVCLCGAYSYHVVALTWDVLILATARPLGPRKHALRRPEQRHGPGVRLSLRTLAAATGVSNPYRWHPQHGSFG